MFNKDIYKHLKAWEKFGYVGSRLKELATERGYLEKSTHIFRKKDMCFYLALIGIILYAFLVRFLRVKYGLPYIHHWEEPSIAGYALNMLKTGDFNPHRFIYPSFTIYYSFVVDILHYYYLMGKDVTDPGYLGSLDAIITPKGVGSLEGYTNWRWTISHPSFYLWNRAFISVFGTASVALTYLITKENYGKTEGILAALFLAGSSFHIRHSVYIAPNIPGAFFVLLVVLFSLRFYYSHKTKDLILSLIFVGIGASCKYNYILSIIVPLSAYLLQFKHLRPNKWLISMIILVLPFVVFLAVNPFVLLDFNTFLTDTGELIGQYKIQEHPGYTSVPGFEHFGLQMARIKSNISSPLFSLAFVGIVVSLRKPKPQFIILIFLAFYMYFMTQQKVNFHRNFVVMYPFFAIFSAVAVVSISTMLYKLCSFLQERYSYKINYINDFCYLIPFLMLAIFLHDHYILEFKHSMKTWKTPERRTQAMDYINTLVDKEEKGNIMIGIAKELRIHRLDLKRLKVDYEIFEHKDINLAPKKYDYLIVGKYRSLYEKNRAEDERLNKLTPQDLVYHSIKGQETRRDAVTGNPEVIILKTPGKVITMVALSKLDGRKKVLKDGSIALLWGGKLKSGKIRLKKSKYEISIVSKGTEVHGKNARIKVYIGNDLIGDYYTTDTYQKKVLKFTSRSEKAQQLVVEFANDYSKPEKNLNRNAWIKSIAIVNIDEQ